MTLCEFAILTHRDGSDMCVFVEHSPCALPLRIVIAA